MVIDFSTNHASMAGEMHTSHGEISQDYAVSEVWNDGAAIVVSDGCSSGGRTDLGSRLQALAYLESLRQARLISKDGEIEEIANRTYLGLEASARASLGLVPEDMLATRLVAYLDLGGGYVRVWGDGVILLKYRDSTVELRKYEWLDNTPFYPSYTTNNLVDFVDFHKGFWSKRFVETRFVGVEGNEFVQVSEFHREVIEGINGGNIHFHSDDIKNLEVIALFTDGLMQIESTDWMNAVKDLTAFKTTNGLFAERRMKTYARNLSKNNLRVFDDLTMAVILLKEIKEDHNEEHSSGA